MSEYRWPTAADLIAQLQVLDPQTPVVIEGAGPWDLNRPVIEDRPIYAVMQGDSATDPEFGKVEREAVRVPAYVLQAYRFQEDGEAVPRHGVVPEQLVARYEEYLGKTAEIPRYDVGHGVRLMLYPVGAAEANFAVREVPELERSVAVPEIGDLVHLEGAERFDARLPAVDVGYGHSASYGVRRELGLVPRAFIEIHQAQHLNDLQALLNGGVGPSVPLGTSRALEPHDLAVLYPKTADASDLHGAVLHNVRLDLEQTAWALIDGVLNANPLRLTGDALIELEPVEYKP